MCRLSSYDTVSFVTVLMRTWEIEGNNLLINIDSVNCVIRHERGRVIMPVSFYVVGHSILFPRLRRDVPFKKELPGGRKERKKKNSTSTNE